ncbi:unnamed protein product, partial [Ectocarpus sp. 4 AP-2014]
ESHILNHPASSNPTYQPTHSCHPTHAPTPTQGETTDQEAAAAAATAGRAHSRDGPPSSSLERKKTARRRQQQQHQQHQHGVFVVVASERGQEDQGLAPANAFPGRALEATPSGHSSTAKQRARSHSAHCCGWRGQPLGRDRERRSESGPGSAALDSARHVPALRDAAARQGLRGPHELDGFQVRRDQPENAAG